MKKKHILIVEDEPIVGMSLKHMLGRLGFGVDVIVSGEDALAAVELRTPALILMDVRLKGAIDGIETASKILQKQFIPIVFLTAYADNEIVDRIKAVGAWAYLEKPYDDIELEKIVHRATS